MSSLTDSSWAVDKNASTISGQGTDQALEGTDWTQVYAERVIWDYNSQFDQPDYDLETSQFNVQVDGVYIHDIELRFKDLVNVKSIQVAIFQINGSEADYWFNFAYRNVLSDEDIIQINEMIQFDFRDGDAYDLRVKLTPIDEESDVSATIDGNDDFTAWSCSWIKQVI